MTETWRQLSITVAEEFSADVQALLLAEGALGLEVVDDETRAVPEKPFVARHVAEIVATFSSGKSPFVPLFQRGEVISYRWGEIADQGWEDRFRAEWKAFSLGEGIWIVPSWEQAQFSMPSDATVVLYLDPGLAFGTGHHETTALCGRGLVHAVRNYGRPEALRVLDVGTGTGILAFIALKLGVKDVVGTDIDHKALEVAMENAKVNLCDDRFQVTDAQPDYAGQVFDIVVANILSQPLIDMAAQIKGALKPKGRLLLSGILRDQAEGVRRAYQAQGLLHLQTEEENGWVLISFQG